MDFLSDSIISASDQTVLGIMVTQFDPADYLSRAKVKLFTVDELLHDNGTLKPMGFRFEAPGTLYSDTAVQRVVADSVFHYMEQESRQFVDKAKDITDLVLMGVAYNGFMIPNAGICDSPEILTQEGIFTPFRNCRVSNSSFNIYAGFRNKNDEFRTCSLLTVEYGEPVKFYAAFPATVDLSMFGNAVRPKMDFEYQRGEWVLYEVELGLRGTNASVGEAFLNYLAYNVSFYNIGEKALRELCATAPKAATLPREEQVPRAARKAVVNVSIEHCFKDCRLDGILSRLNDNDELTSFVREVPEAQITFQWLQKVYSSPWVVDNNGSMSEDDAVYTACTNLLSELRATRLKFALELLTHRYYIYMLGVGNDFLGPLLKGGGVNGESVKQISLR